MVPRCNHATILGFDQSIVHGLNQISECTSAVVYIALFSFLVGGLQKSKSLSVTVSPDVVSKVSKMKNSPLPRPGFDFFIHRFDFIFGLVAAEAGPIVPLFHQLPPPKFFETPVRASVARSDESPANNRTLRRRRFFATMKKKKKKLVPFFGWKAPNIQKVFSVVSRFAAKKKRRLWKNNPARERKRKQRAQ